MCAASEALTMQERTGHGCLSLCLCVAAVEGSTLFLAVSVTGNVSVVCVCLHGFDFFCFVRFFGEGFGGRGFVWVFLQYGFISVYMNQNLRLNTVLQMMI